MTKLPSKIGSFHIFGSGGIPHDVMSSIRPGYDV